MCSSATFLSLLAPHHWGTRQARPSSPQTGSTQNNTSRSYSFFSFISAVCKTTKNFRQILIYLASVRDVFQRQEIADSEANRGGETGSGQNIKAVGAESWTPLLRPHASLPWTLLVVDNATMPLKPLFTPFCHFAFGIFLDHSLCSCRKI